MTIFNNTDVQLELLGTAIWDRHWLRAVGDVVTQDDFRPVAKDTSSIPWVVAGLALDFYKKNRTPIGSMIGVEMVKWARTVGASPDRKIEIAKFIKMLKQRYDPARSAILQEAVINFKRTKQRQGALRELIDLEEAGELSDAKWLEVMRSALNNFNHVRARDYLEELDTRHQRRMSQNSRRYPDLMIDPLDARVRAIGRGHVGLWLAPYKMGKSMALIWTATSYLFQGFNVLYFTLEDPVEDVEDRMDACVTEMCIADLGFQGTEVETRFDRLRSRLSSSIRIIDGTEGGMSVHQMETIWERLRVEGFDVDVVVVDYDDEIKAPVKRMERRQEFADIYREIRMFAARSQVFFWTAAQAIRAAEGKTIVGANMVAEDISKIRKVTMALGIGTGEWGPESRHIYVAAHKFDAQRFGVNMFTAPERGVFYDRERTVAQLETEKFSGMTNEV